MRISLSWLSCLIDVSDCTTDRIANELTSCGLEVGSVDAYEPIPGCLEGLVVGEVIECIKHPNADTLHCLKVDIGSIILSVVCGAPNVRAGIKVVVVLPNGRISTFGGESITIKKSKIRGEVSEGMLCSEYEIGLSNNHDSIIELDGSYANGTPVADVYGIKKDDVLDIELTPNRGDACSHIGIARSLSVILCRDVVQPELIEVNINCGTSIDIVNDAIDACCRYDCVVVNGVKVKDSPQWIKDRLQAVGIRPINNIVDITNYVMIELGQPMHAYDLAKVNGNITIRYAHDDESIKALNGEIYRLKSTDLVIADKDGALSIAGIIGGEASSISENTTGVLFEAAKFDPLMVRKCASRLKIKTEASYRFERGCDVEMPMMALQRACYLLKDQCDEAIIDGSSEYYDRKPSRSFEVSLRHFEDIIGQPIDHQLIIDKLTRLRVELQQVGDGLYVATIPSFMNNVTREVDLIDEFMRFYGYENVHIDEMVEYTVDFKNTALDAARDYDFKECINNYLVSCGFCEIRTNSLISCDDLCASENGIIKLANPSSTEMNIMRPDLVYSGLSVVSFNVNMGNKSLMLFDFGKHYNDDQKYESEHIGLFMTGMTQNLWNSRAVDFSFFDLKSYVVSLLHIFGIDNCEEYVVDRRYFSRCLRIVVGENELVVLGTVDDTLLNHFGIKQNVLYANINFRCLFDYVRFKSGITYKKIPNTQCVSKDLSILVDDAVTFKDISDTILGMNDNVIRGISVFDVYSGDGIPIGKKSYALSIKLQDDRHTLTSTRIQNILGKVSKCLSDVLHGVIRSK